MQELVKQRMKTLENHSKLVGPYSIKISDVKTGAWRYRRPVIRQEGCILCGICADYCPCGVVEKQEGKMVIDYTYCKGCGICTVECPKKTIDFVLESDCKEEQ